MLDNRRVQRNNGVSNLNSSGHNIEEAIRRLEFRTEGKENNGAVVARYPDRPGEPDCIFYLRTGLCGYGSNCRFNHPAHIGQNGGELPKRVGEPDCMYFLKTGTCKYGSTCIYNHPRDSRGAGPVVLNMVGLPMRREEKSCAHYVRTGSCKFGVACKFHHPQPTLNGSKPPVSIVPSSGSPFYVNGTTPWPLHRSTYVSDPQMQSPQTYLPIVLPLTPTQAWSTYVGTTSSVFSTVLSGGSGSNLPERPGEPECRYFMNTGNCKYGLDCKYHHPREKFAQMAASSLSPLGLPLRPGQGVCSYYSLYGTCVYGPSCKYDHPVMVYSYNYNMSLPGLSVLDPSLLRNSPAFHSPWKNQGWTGKDTSNRGSPEHVGSPDRSSSAESEVLENQSD